MMLSVVILFAAALIPINQIYCVPGLNLDDLLELLDIKQNNAPERSDESSVSDDSSDTGDADNTLRGRQIVKFLQQSLDEKSNKRLTQNKHLSKLYTHLANVNDNRQSRYLVNNKQDVDSYAENKNSNQVDQFLQYLLSQADKKQRKAREDEAAKVNREDSDNDGNLDEYSRIYIILNPEALKSNKNQKKLSALVSRLMSKSSSVPQNRVLGGPKEVRYKGYPVRDIFAQRRRRDSMEGYSVEDSYGRPKRPRYSNNYGGVGAGGRTAIPYIRHRGDIYERDQ